MIPQRRGAADATIARLEVRADRADSIVARLAVERILGAMELRPDSLLPSAILCVRELRDPRPGTISLASRQLWPPPVWEQAVRREVNRLARAAARPAHGVVPAAAEAVVFADESELLACLGSDLVAGVVGARWWWPLLVEGVGQPRRATVQAWLRAPEHVPAALQVLADRREAEAFVRILDDRDVRDLADAVVKTFGLPAVVTDVDAVRRSGLAVATMARPRAPVGFAEAASVAGQAAVSTELHAVSAPWSAIAPEAERAVLSIEQRALLGVALTIARAPLLARSREFVTELAAWRAVASLLPRPDVATASERALWSGLMSPPTAAAPITRLDRAARAVDHFVQDETVVGSLAAGTIEVTIPTTEGAVTPMELASLPRLAAERVSLPPVSATVPMMTPAADEPPTTSPPLPGDAQATGEPSRRSAVVSRKPPTARARSRALGPPIQTRLGGLFYLVNLALYFRLYGDDGENLPLPLWDLVTLVGRALLGDAAIADDPVWTLLAELAGRVAEEPPGGGFMPPADWRLPPAWLASFEAAARYHASPDRLVISHAEGFMIVDVEAQGDLASQLTVELAPYGAITCVPSADASPLASPADPPLDRWLARLLPYLRARLRRVLAVDDAGLPALLLAHHARLHVTDTHLDIVLRLETLPIEIRFSGLDRDPGWIAAAGRFIAFHFE